MTYDPNIPVRSNEVFSDLLGMNNNFSLLEHFGFDHNLNVASAKGFHKKVTLQNTLDASAFPLNPLETVLYNKHGSLHLDYMNASNVRVTQQVPSQFSSDFIFSNDVLSIVDNKFIRTINSIAPTGNANIALQSSDSTISISGLVGSVNLKASMNNFISSDTDNDLQLGSDQKLYVHKFNSSGVGSLNGKSGDVLITAGTHVTIDNSNPHSIIISSAGGPTTGDDFAYNNSIYISNSPETATPDGTYEKPYNIANLQDAIDANASSQSRVDFRPQNNSQPTLLTGNVLAFKNPNTHFYLDKLELTGDIALDFSSLTASDEFYESQFDFNKIITSATEYSITYTPHGTKSGNVKKTHVVNFNIANIRSTPCNLFSLNKTSTIASGVEELVVRLKIENLVLLGFDLTTPVIDLSRFNITGLDKVTLYIEVENIYNLLTPTIHKHFCKLGGSNDSVVVSINNKKDVELKYFDFSRASKVEFSDSDFNNVTQEELYPDNSIFFCDNSTSLMKYGTFEYPYQTLDVAFKNATFKAHLNSKTVNLVFKDSCSKTFSGQTYNIGHLFTDPTDALCDVVIHAQGVTFNNCTFNIDLQLPSKVDNNELVLKCKEFNNSQFKTSNPQFVLGTSSSTTEGLVVKLECETKKIQTDKSNFVCDLSTATTGQQLEKTYITYIENVNTLIESGVSASHSPSIEFLTNEFLENTMLRAQVNYSILEQGNVVHTQQKSPICSFTGGVIQDITKKPSLFFYISGLAEDGVYYDFTNVSSNTESNLQSSFLIGGLVKARNVNATNNLTFSTSVGGTLKLSDNFVLPKKNAPLEKGQLIYDPVYDDAYLVDNHLKKHYLSHGSNSATKNYFPIEVSGCSIVDVYRSEIRIPSVENMVFEDGEHSIRSKHRIKSSGVTINCRLQDVDSENLPVVSDIAKLPVGSSVNQLLVCKMLDITLQSAVQLSLGYRKLTIIDIDIKLEDAPTFKENFLCGVTYSIFGNLPSGGVVEVAFVPHSYVTTETTDTQKITIDSYSNIGHAQSLPAGKYKPFATSGHVLTQKANFKELRIGSESSFEIGRKETTDTKNDFFAVPLFPVVFSDINNTFNSWVLMGYNPVLSTENNTSVKRKSYERAFRNKYVPPLLIDEIARINSVIKADVIFQTMGWNYDIGMRNANVTHNLGLSLMRNTITFSGNTFNKRYFIGGGVYSAYNPYVFGDKCKILSSQTAPDTFYISSWIQDNIYTSSIKVACVATSTSEAGILANSDIALTDLARPTNKEIYFGERGTTTWLSAVRVISISEFCTPEEAVEHYSLQITDVSISELQMIITETEGCCLLSDVEMAYNVKEGFDPAPIQPVQKSISQLSNVQTSDNKNFIMED